MRKGTKLLFGNIWKYLLVAVAAILIWSGIYEMLDTIRDNQRLTISVYNTNCDTQALREELVQVLPTLTDQVFLEVYVDDMEHIPNQTYASDLLTMQLLQCDLVIMPESLLKSLSVPVYFPELPASLAEGRQTYQVEGKAYGILLTDRFAGFCQSSEPCYLLLSSNSVNLGGILDRGEAADDGGLQVLYYLIEEGGP